MATAAFSEGNAVFGGFETAMLKGIGIDSVTGSISQMIHAAFRASFACITVALVVGGFAERIRFSAVLIFAIVWFTLSYLPIAHMVWGGGYGHRRRIGLRRRHRGAHQRRQRRVGRCLPDRQACRLR